MFDPRDWYWVIAGDDHVWSSQAAARLAMTDNTFSAWCAAGRQPTHIASMDELRDVLSQQYPAGMPSTYAAFKRWQKESGGIIVAGVPVATDDRSKLMITGARIAADADPNFSTPWVGVDGDVYPLTAAQIVAISNAVSAHVAECFAIYATIKSGIDDGSITSLSQIDAAFA
jgi:hypothetical protein